VRHLIFIQLVTILFIALSFLISGSAFALDSTISIVPDITSDSLLGSDVGNRPSFEFKFALDPVPVGAVVSSAKIVYTQTGVSAGLVRIIDKYSADVIDSKALNNPGGYEITAILPYIRQWIASPSKNFGLLFQSSGLDVDDSVAVQNIALQLVYYFKDTTFPIISGAPIVEAGSNYSKIEFLTDESSLVNLEYGRSSAYGQTLATDNIEASLGHLFTLENLTSGTTYHYRALITDTSGNKTISRDYTFDTIIDFEISDNKPVDQSLKAPQKFSVVASYTLNRARTNLSWNPVDERGVKGYIVYKADSALKKYKELATLDYTTTTYMDDEVDLGQTYFYYVRSFSDSVISPKSQENSLSLPASIPGQPAESPATLQTFLVILASASIVIFAFYVVIKIVQKVENGKNARLKNVLKDPEHYLK